MFDSLLLMHSGKFFAFAYRLFHEDFSSVDRAYICRIDRKTSNIYGILCKNCKKVVYVGETGTTLYERFSNHISSTRRNKDEPIVNHFNGKGHKVDDLKILGIEMLNQNNIHQRKIRESLWIEKLNTISPQGLNQNKGVGDQDRGIQM